MHRLWLAACVRLRSTKALAWPRLNWLVHSLWMAALLPSLACSAKPVLDNGPLLTKGELTNFDQQFRHVLAKAAVPGGAYAIVQAGTIVATGAYGVREQGKPERVNAHTVFRLASVSKTFTGALLLQQVQRLQLRLQTPLRQFVPQLRLGNSRATQALTVEHVLTQSSGLMPHAFENLLEAGQTPEQILPKFQQLTNLCAAGRCYSYQNVLFSTLSRVAEQSSGSRFSFEQLLSQQLLKPLQMDSSSGGYAGYLAATNKASPHRKQAGRWRVLSVQPEFYRVNAAAGVNASARDMAKYLLAMTGHAPQVLSPAVLEQLRQPKVPVSTRLKWPLWQRFSSASSWYGHGWRLVQFDQHRLYYHGGVVDGFRPYLAYSAEHDIGLVVLTNAEADVTGDIAQWFWQHILG